MPCYQVQTVSVEFKIAHADLLVKATTALGWAVVGTQATRMVICPKDSYSTMTIDLATGKAIIELADQSRLNELKRAYSQQAIKLAANLNGWAVQSKTMNKGLLLKGSL
jgi:hypothetical protein